MNNEVLDLLARRRTVRRFTGQPVSDEQAEKLLEAAFYAPSYLNRRPWHFLMIRDERLRERLGSILGVRNYVQDASLLIGLLGDPEISNTWEIDLSAAGENILIAATGLGLGSTWVGNPHGAAWELREEQMRELLAIPKDKRIFGFIAVGYPEVIPEPHKKEEAWDTSRVHYDQFGHLDNSGMRRT